MLLQWKLLNVITDNVVNWLKDQIGLDWQGPSCIFIPITYFNLLVRVISSSLSQRDHIRPQLYNNLPGVSKHCASRLNGFDDLLGGVAGQREPGCVAVKLHRTSQGLLRGLEIKKEKQISWIEKITQQIDYLYFHSFEPIQC